MCIRDSPDTEGDLGGVRLDAAADPGAHVAGRPVVDRLVGLAAADHLEVAHRVLAVVAGDDDLVVAGAGVVRHGELADQHLLVGAGAHLEVAGVQFVGVADAGALGAAGRGVHGDGGAGGSGGRGDLQAAEVTRVRGRSGGGETERDDGERGTDGAGHEAGRTAHGDPPGRRRERVCPDPEPTGTPPPTPPDTTSAFTRTDRRGTLAGVDHRRWGRCLWAVRSAPAARVPIE